MRTYYDSSAVSNNFGPPRAVYVPDYPRGPIKRHPALVPFLITSAFGAVALIGLFSMDWMVSFCSQNNQECQTIVKIASIAVPVIGAAISGAFLCRACRSNNRYESLLSE